MRKILACSCFLFIILGLVGCGSAEQESNKAKGNSADTLEENKGVIKEIKEKSEKELSVDHIFVPEMAGLEIKNAFVSFSGEEPFSVDVQYHAEVSDKDERFENEIIVEEEQEKTGMKHLVPPYVNGGDMYFWLVFSKLDMPEMLNNEEGGINEQWVEIGGSEVLFRNNGTNYNYFIAVDEGYYMFSYNIEHYSQEEVEELTKTFISEI